MEPLELLTAAVIGAVYGIVYAGYGVITKREQGEPVSVRKAARSAVLFGAAGVIVSLRQGTELSLTNVDQATTEVAVIGVVFDWGWSALKRNGYLDWIHSIPLTGPSPE